jgi:hypothetical protein
MAGMSVECGVAESHLRGRMKTKPKALRKNLYVTEADVATWEAAVERAKELRVSLSSLVVEALAQYLG